MNDESKSVIFLMGPTAAGKTDLSLKMIEQLPCEIISVDSAMIYRDMDIGTGKPSLVLRQKIPHHLIDILDPTDNYSAADFRNDALKQIEMIFAKGKIPLLVGGTMLYFKALRDGLVDLPKANPEIRSQLKMWVEQEGLASIHRRLMEIDPVSAKRINPNDPQRLLRALEVFLATGQNFTSHLAAQKAAPFPYNIISIALSPDERAILHARIELRFYQMLNHGFVEEVKAIQQKYAVSPHLPSMRSVGYRQILQYLAGEFSYEEMSNRAIFATRQLAKRQLTWLRAWPSLNWFDSEDPHNLQKVLRVITEESI